MPQHPDLISLSSAPLSGGPTPSFTSPTTTIETSPFYGSLNATQNTFFKYLRFLPLLIMIAAASLGLRLGLILMSLHTA